MKIAEFFASIGFKVDTQGIDQFTKQLDNIEKRIRQVKAEAVSLNMTLQKTGKIRGGLGKVTTAQGAKSAAKSVSNLNASAETGAAKISHYTARINRLANAMARLATNASGVVLPSGRVSLSGEGRGVQGGGGGRGPNRGVFSGAAFGSFLGSNNAFIRNILPFAGASLAAAMIKSTVDVGQRMMGSRIAVQSVAGSPMEGQRNWEFVNALAERLGVSLLSTADQFAKISAAAQGTELQGEQIRNIFQSIAEFGRARMVEPERLNLSLRAVGQMINKQQIMAEELKSQFGEHLPGAMQLAAKAMDMTVPELFKAVEAGEVMADDFLPKLAKALAEAAREGGALEKSLQMAQVEQGRFYKVVTEFASGIFQVVNKPLGELWQQLSVLFKKFSAAAVGSFFRFVIRLLELFVRTLGYAIDGISALGKAISDSAGYLVQLVIIMGSWAVVLALVTGRMAVVSGIFAAVALHAKKLKFIGVLFAAMNPAILLIAAGIGGLILLIDELVVLSKGGTTLIELVFRDMFNKIIDNINSMTNRLGFGNILDRWRPPDVQIPKQTRTFMESMYSSASPGGSVPQSSQLTNSLISGTRVVHNSSIVINGPATPEVVKDLDEMQRDRPINLLISPPK